MNAPNISDPGKEYFLKIASKKWNFREAFTLYEHTLKLPFNIVCGIMESDLNLIVKSRKAFVEPSNAIFSDLQFYVKQMESQQPSQQHIIAGSINDNYNNCSNLTKNIYHTNSDRKRKNKDSDGIELDSSNSAASLLLNKAKKSYSFHPLNVTPSISTNKPRINVDDAKKLNDYFVTVIGPHSGDETLNCTRQEYELNMEEQRVLYSFKKRASTFNLLNSCLNGTLDNLLDCLDNTKANIGNNDDERQDIRLLHYILSDYHANCSKPSYIVIPNERTPFAEYIIPIFKYFSASTKLLSFIWCEKGSASNKQLMLCLSESQRKLLDGIGFSCKDKVERLMMECSGEEDGIHTEEDTLKLMEYTSNCLKNEINQYQYASWTTFGRRRVFAIQCVGNKLTLLSTSRMGIGKWCFVEMRSAIVPRDWEDRYYLNRLMELLMKLKEMLLEQEEVTMVLKQQQSGRSPVDIKDTIKAVSRSGQVAEEL